MTGKLKIDITEDILLQAIEEKRKAIALYRPKDYSGETDLRLKLSLSDRQFDLKNPLVNLVGYEGLKPRLNDVGARNLRDLFDLMSGAYISSGIPRDQMPPLLLVEWKSLKPVRDRPPPLLSLQSADLTRRNFSGLFFIRGSEAWQAERDNRPPVPIKTGTIRAGHRDFHLGPMRLVEVDDRQKPTGWEVVANIQKKGVWHGALEKIPKRYALASGFHTTVDAIKGIFNLYADLGRPLANLSAPVTGIIFDPVQKDRIAYRPKAELA